MKTFVTSAAVIVITLMMMAGITWAASLLVNPLHFFSTIGLITCGITCGLLVFMVINKSQSGWVRAKTKLAARKKSKQEARAAKLAKKAARNQK